MEKVAKIRGDILKIGCQKAIGHAREKAAILRTVHKSLEEVATSQRVKVQSLVVICSTVGQI